jgi:hypothetical protein
MFNVTAIRIEWLRKNNSRVCSISAPTFIIYEVTVKKVSEEN